MIGALGKMRDLELESETEISNQLSDDNDGDLCENLNEIFTECPHICRTTVAPKQYILHVSATLDHNPNIVVALADHSCEIYNLSNQQLAKIATFSEHTEPIVEVKFGKDSNLVYTASNDGSVRLWDLRTPKKSKIQFIDRTNETNNLHKSLTCFDISPNNRLLAAGTNLYEGDAYILYWDIRKHTFLGGYWESHTDDITQVKFQPDDPNRLISGSVDGLINIFDLSQTEEDSALVDTLNTESSIEKLQWHDNVISCITHTAEIQLWKVDGAEPYLHLHRLDIAKAIMRASEDFLYVVDVHKSNQLFALAGSNYGNGECLRGITIDRQAPKPTMVLSENSQLVRSSWFNTHNNLLLTGGEKGILDVWTVSLPENQSTATKKPR